MATCKHMHACTTSCIRGTCPRIDVVSMRPHYYALVRLLMTDHTLPPRPHTAQGGGGEQGVHALMQPGAHTWRH